MTSMGIDVLTPATLNVRDGAREQISGCAVVMSKVLTTTPEINVLRTGRRVRAWWYAIFAAPVGPASNDKRINMANLLYFLKYVDSLVVGRLPIVTKDRYTIEDLRLT